MNTDFLDAIPDRWKIYGIAMALALKWGGEAFSAIRKGGGLRRILFSVWFGENVPAPIADDYKHELDTKKTAQPPVSNP